MHIPYLCLIVVLLEDKQKFKHGGVWQVSYMHGYFEWFGLIFGVNLHYLLFYAYISPITLSFGLFGFSLQISMCRAKYWEKSMMFKPSQVKRVRKTSPIGPSRITQGKNPRTTKEHKTQRSRSVGTAVARGHHGLPVVGVARPCWITHMAMRLLVLPICVFLSCPFVFLRSFHFVLRICL